MRMYVYEGEQCAGEFWSAALESIMFLALSLCNKDDENWDGKGATTGKYTLVLERVLLTNVAVNH